jgi:putative transposase
MQLDDEDARPAFLVRDRDSKFTRDFDEVFRSQGMRVIKAPARAPKARAHAERWVGSVRRECLDRLLILGRRHLASVLREYTSHYNEHRPHRSLEQLPPLVTPAATEERPAADVIQLDRVRRRDRLGGLIHEYDLAAPALGPANQTKPRRWRRAALRLSGERAPERRPSESGYSAPTRSRRSRVRAGGGQRL